MLRSLVPAMTVAGLFLTISPAAGGPSSGGSQSKRAVAVPDFKARGLEETIVQNLTEVVIKEVDRLGIFRMISMDDIRQMLAHEQSKVMMGCDDTSCLAEIGGALGVDLLLAGSVGKVGETYVISLRLIDVRKAEVISREERTVSGKVEELLDVSRQAAKVLMRPIMRQEAGKLELTCTEEGAEVYIDDLMVGTTPLQPREVPGGYHNVRVAKKRFVVFAKDVKVEPRETARLEVVLVASGEFIEEYESSAKTYRTLAWTLSAVGLAAAGTASGLFAWNHWRRDEYHKDFAAYDGFMDPGGTEKAKLNDKADSIETVEGVTIGMTALAVASVGAALYFWLAGDTPGRYRKQVEVEPKVGPGVAGFTATCRF